MTKLERLILIRQSEILRIIDPDNSGMYTNHVDILENGYSLEMTEFLETHVQDGLTDDECCEVLAILEMSFRIKLADPDAKIPFEGFDFNDDREHSYSRYVNYLFRKGRQFDLNLSECPNSHGQMLDTYRRQVEAWKESDNKYKLTADDLERIAKARIHPDNRQQ